MKGAALIVFALFIDGIQAALSAGVAVISAFPGTFAGGAAGCLAGKALAGDIGCGIGGFLLGALGSLPIVNGILDPLTIPFGIILGFAVSICISVTFGVALIGLLIFNRMYYPKFIFGGSIIELLPGFDIIPSWTAMTILCVLRKNKNDKLARQKVAAGLQEVMQTDLGDNSYIQAGGRKVLTPYQTPQVDGIRAPELQTNAA